MPVAVATCWRTRACARACAQGGAFHVLRRFRFHAARTSQQGGGLIITRASSRAERAEGTKLPFPGP
eukprot:10190098-Alexandrium_andersonii.AAC.1